MCNIMVWSSADMVVGTGYGDFKAAMVMAVQAHGTMVAGVNQVLVSELPET